MKKIIYITTLIGMMAGFLGCEKELKDYDGQEGVYFYVQWGVDWFDSTYWAAQPYTKVEFVKTGEPEIQLKVRVQVTGGKKDYDRRFRVVVDEDSTTAIVNENYEPLEEFQILPKNSHYTDIWVTVRNSKALEEVERKLVLKLLPTEELALSVPVWVDWDDMLSNDAGLAEFDATRHTILMNDFISRPSEWSGTSNPVHGTRETGLFGIFSKKKYDEIIKEFPEITYEDFNSPEAMPMARQYVIANRMVTKLQKLYDVGTPILEDDGRLMWFSGVSWVSYYGIPYVPGE